MLDMATHAETGALELSEIVFSQLKQDTVQGNPASRPKIPANFEGQVSCVQVSYCSNHMCQIQIKNKNKGQSKCICGEKMNK